MTSSRNVWSSLHESSVSYRETGSRSARRDGFTHPQKFVMKKKLKFTPDLSRVPEPVPRLAEHCSWPVRRPGRRRSFWRLAVSYAEIYSNNKLQ